MIQKSTSLKYEPSLELLRITAEQLFSNRELYRSVQLGGPDSRRVCDKNPFHACQLENSQLESCQLENSQLEKSRSSPENSRSNKLRQVGQTSCDKSVKQAISVSPASCYCSYPMIQRTAFLLFVPHDSTYRLSIIRT